MWTQRKIEQACLWATALAVAITILFMNGESLGLAKTIDQDREENAGAVYFTANDLVQEWNASHATRIQLSPAGAKVQGQGAYVKDGNVYVVRSGFYAIKGEYTAGSIIVDARSDAKVWLLLEGVDMACDEDACIRVEQADKVFLNLADGTENTLSSGSFYSEEAIRNGVDGALFSRDDLTINGKGKLTVSAGYWHGIVVKDELVVTGGSITVHAPQDTIHANDSCRMTGCDMVLHAGDEGISVSGKDGSLYMESGKLSIDAKEDAIHAASDIVLDDGEIAVSTWDDAIHSDTGIYLYDGELLARNCHEGIEASLIEVHGGKIRLYPDNDGFNAVEGETGIFPTILVAGGDIEIVNKNDGHAAGFDSNGDLIVTGGSIRISLVDNGKNIALDYGEENGGIARIDGGTIIACGSVKMAEGFGQDSTQCSILYGMAQPFPGDTMVSLEDSKGNTWMKYKVPCAFSSMVMSCPEMAVSKACVVVAGEFAESILLRETTASFGDAQSEKFEGPVHAGGLAYRGEANGSQKNLRPASTPVPEEEIEHHALPGKNARKEEPAKATTLVSGETWRLLGISSVALLLAILYAKQFRERIK